MNRELIRQAVKCAYWQRTRKGLKGLPTVRKLYLLRAYRNSPDSRLCSCTQEMVDIQVLNYLNALARGGLIEPLKKGLSQLDRVKITVRR